MKGTPSPEELRAFKAEEKAARETLSSTLGDIEENADGIDEQCRSLVREILDGLDNIPADQEDGNAADMLRHVAEIWSLAHNIRRSVERDDEPDDGSGEIRGMVSALQGKAVEQ